MDELRRDYDVKDLEEQSDPRFEITTKEAKFTMGLYIVMAGLATVMSYALCPKDISQMTYIMGLPAWFFAAGAVEVVVFVITMVFNQKFSKEFSLDAKADERGEK